MALVTTRNSVERADKRTAGHAPSSVLFHFPSHVLVGILISSFEMTDISLKLLGQKVNACFCEMSKLSFFGCLGIYNTTGCKLSQLVLFQTCLRLGNCKFVVIFFTIVSPAFTHTGIPLVSSRSVFDKATTNRCLTPSLYAQLKVTISAHINTFTSEIPRTFLALACQRCQHFSQHCIPPRLN